VYLGFEPEDDLLPGLNMSLLNYSKRGISKNSVSCV